MMHTEWSHLHLTTRDRKRKLAADALAQQACDDAVTAMLASICDALDHYAVGHTSEGALYYQVCGAQPRVNRSDPLPGPPKRSKSRRYRIPTPRHAVPPASDGGARRGGGLYFR